MASPHSLLQTFNKEKRITAAPGGGAQGMRDLSQMIKKMPQHQKELAKVGVIIIVMAITGVILFLLILSFWT